MSDSDSDELLSRNVFTFQNERTVVSGCGPSGNYSNRSHSFKNNLLSSTTQMAPMYSRYAESSYGQQSLYNKREASHMSARSVCNIRQRNYNYSFNPRGISAQRSVCGRGGSPMSMRSIDTSASVLSAVDIANALRTEHFSKHELKVIEEAYNRFVRCKVRKRMDKRPYRKIRRRINGEDSGEQGSDSSISSDNQSTRTNIKDNMSHCRSTDITNFRRTIQSNIFKDCRDNFKYSSSRSEIGGPVNFNSTQASLMSNRSIIAGPTLPLIKNMPKPPANFSSVKNLQVPSVILQKERFTSGFLLPSQRFNSSVNSKEIPVINETVYQNSNLQNAITNNPGRTIDTDSDDDEIFSKTSQTQNNKERKRSIDCVDNDDIYLQVPTKKRQKILTPCKNSKEATKVKAVDNDDANGFIFAKPAFPVRKNVKEKLIAKSAAPSLETLSEDIIAPANNTQMKQKYPIAEEKDKIEEDLSNSTQNSTKSFTKRKLFSQKLDVLEKNNINNDNINSPQNSYDTLQKEKHKVRKLQQVTTQSCLSRDIHQNNNLLDLIHKIVPKNQMNVTNQTNKTDRYSKNMTEHADDKWDVTSIIDTQKNDDVGSVTYTDEELLSDSVTEVQEDSDPKQKKENKENTWQEKAVNSKEKVTKQNAFKKPSPTKPKDCRVLLEKMSPNVALTRFKQFWDIDFESDVECQPASNMGHLNTKENIKSDVPHDEAPANKRFNNILSLKKLTGPSTSTVENNSIHTFNITALEVMSHRAPNRVKTDKTFDLTSKTVTDLKGQKRNICLPLEQYKEIAKVDHKVPKDIANKKEKKTPKCKQQATKKSSKQNVSSQKSNSKIKENSEDKNTKKESKSVTTPEKFKNEKPSNLRNKKLKNTEIKQVEPLQNKNSNNKTQKKTLKNNSTLTEENNNNSITRAIRSCRLDSRNASKSNLDLNDTMNRTLRSRKIDISVESKEKHTIAHKSKNVEKVAKAKVDVSLTYPVDKNAVVKRAVKKINAYLSKADESDVSFSLPDESPTPRNTRARAAAKNNLTKSVLLKLKDTPYKDTFISKRTPNRTRLPNKKYLG